MTGLKMIKHIRNTFWDVTDTVGFQNTTALGEGEDGDALMEIIMTMIIFPLMGDYV